MKKLLLILLCVPMIGFGQSKKDLRLIISQKSDSLKLFEDQKVIQDNQFSDKLKVQEDSLSNLNQEINNLKNDFRLYN